MDRQDLYQPTGFQRAQRVNFTPSIYEDVTRVLVWIGPLDDDVSYPLDLHKTVLRNNAVDWIAEKWEYSFTDNVTDPELDFLYLLHGIRTMHVGVSTLGETEGRR
ncbi:hypothetical protein PMIN06_004908 [Paraphaeosphaeria minitans]